MAALLLLNLIEMRARINSLLRTSDALKELGTKYQEDMGSMAEAWQGSSGTSFAEAAEKVQAGFYVNGFALWWMIDDVTTTRRLVADQDTLAAGAIDAMATQLLPDTQGGQEQ